MDKMPGDLTEDEGRIRLVLDQLFAFVGITSVEGVLLEANRAPLEAAGIEAADVLGKPFWDAYWWSHSAGVQAQLRDAITRAAAGEVVRYDAEVRMAGDTRAVIDFQIGPLRDEHGRITHLIPSAVDVTERRRTEQRLLETERRLNAVLNNASVAIFLMDERQHCSYMNAAAERLTGYRLEETQGRPLHDVIHHTRPDGSHFPLEECPIDRAFPENNNQQGEEVFVHKDGHFYPVAFTASPIRDQASRTIGTIIEGRDVSAEKRNEQARDLLMREVDHRARNALAVVQSILQLTASADMEAYKQTVLGRVSALARAQGSLADQRWEGAFLHEVLQEELAALAMPEQFRLEGERVMLAPSLVQSLSMIVHELGTNAVKYGALARSGGRVAIGWSRTPGALSLDWRESGGPPVAEPSGGGFGSRLMRQLARQMEADLEFDWRPEGLHVSLVLPLPGGA